MDETVRSIKYNLEKDIVLKLKKREGEHVKGNTGLVDNRLFTGDNKLHALMDTQTTLWYLKYDNGIVPQALQQRWTSFPKLLKYATDYFDKRNIDVVEQ